MESEPEPRPSKNNNKPERVELDPEIAAYGIVRDQSHVLLKKSETGDTEQKSIVYEAFDTSLITSLDLLKKKAVDENGRPAIPKWVEQHFNQLLRSATLTVGRKAALVERHESSDGKLRVFFNIKAQNILALPSLEETEIISLEDVQKLLSSETVEREGVTYALQPDTRNALTALNKVFEQENAVPAETKPQVHRSFIPKIVTYCIHLFRKTDKVKKVGTA